MECRNSQAAKAGRNYYGVQALRAIAAALVVVHHSITTWLDWIVHRPGAHQWGNGATGVDIFFTISGFVMAISLPGLAGKTNRAGVFLWRRITRIVPLYWGATTLKLLLLKFRPASGGAGAPVLTPWRIAASYLFIPARNWRGEMFPVIDAGWTLNYEIFFYLLFAAALALNISPLAFLTPCLTAIALLGMARPAGWPDATSLASPLVLEFLYGVLLAHFAMRRKLPGAAIATILLIGGFVTLMLMPQTSAEWRFIPWGIPAAAVVTGAVALEGRIGGHIPRWLLEAGDASYALYLVHILILPFLGSIMGHLHLKGIAGLAAVITLGLGVSLPASVLVHRFIEKPMMNLFKKKPAPAPAPAVTPVIAEPANA
jgi:peptidoglycan/LPS O-acetylase OafA/YrhL